MTFIKNLILGVIGYVVLAIASVIGMGIGGKLWENGLEERVQKKTEKWFSK